MASAAGCGSACRCAAAMMTGGLNAALIPRLRATRVGVVHRVARTLIGGVHLLPVSAAWAPAGRGRTGEVASMIIRIARSGAGIVRVPIGVGDGAGLYCVVQAMMIVGVFRALVIAGAVFRALRWAVIIRAGRCALFHQT